MSSLLRSEYFHTLPDHFTTCFANGSTTESFQIHIFEFFVAEQQDLNDGGRKGGTSVWEDKYKLITEAVPSIVTQQFANKVFLIGKSLNFIRHDCQDGSWVETYSTSASK